MFNLRVMSKESSPKSEVTVSDDKVELVDPLIPVEVDLEIIGDADGGDDVDVEVNVDDVPAQKRHFLDYDAVPPPGFEEHFDKVLSFGASSAPRYAGDLKSSISTLGVSFGNSISRGCTGGGEGEQLKLDKRYERDGEVSDFELTASGYTKKEFTQDDNTLHLTIASGSGSISTSGSVSKKRLLGSRKGGTFAKPKHFLDENPIPPDYLLEQELRERSRLEHQSTDSQHVGDGSGGAARKNSLDRASSGSHSSRERLKEPSYTLSRFLDSEGLQSHSSLPHYHLAKEASAWSESLDSRYGSLPPPPASDILEVDLLGPKVECVYSLLSMLGSNDPLEMSKKFLELSRNPETCVTLRRSGCIPLLVQMMHSEGEEQVRKFASAALHNVVHRHLDEKAGRREAKVLRLLDQIIDYYSFLKTLLQSGGEAIADDSDRHPLAAMSSLMKVSFDQEHRQSMCELGALQAIPNLVHLDHAVHGPKPEDQCCNSLRRYALMALTNLTFGDENNKALLCSQKLFMEALVAQLDAAPDDLLQVTASVLRNLSWRADSNMKAVLNEIGTVTALAKAAMKNKNENTLKAILSALWNLSAHCSTNKAEFCAVDGALAFLVDMLTYEGPSKTLKIIENAGGILRNVSSHIAVREHYRQILREHNCLAILLQQLKSESLTVVSNSCGTLWNLSARCPEDQKFLWDNGAVPMLRSLIHSKHAMISEGSSSALKNLLNFRPSIQNQNQLDAIARSMNLKKLPTLNVRKQRALERELGEKVHSETCDNLDNVSKDAPTTSMHRSRFPITAGATSRLTRSAMLTKSESRDSVFSAKSDSAYENLMRSQSASETTRKIHNATQKIPFAALHVPRSRAAFALESVDIETTEEQPIDYAAKYNENVTTAKALDVVAAVKESSQQVAVTSATYAAYQETDLDQPTDFSLRYAENQVESDVDVSPSETAHVTNDAKHTKEVNTTDGNEILLILEDSVKCYQTEDTPYVISNAPSVTDLRQATKNECSGTVESHIRKGAETAVSKKYQKQQQGQAVAYGFDTYTPEKPINYCEEGTPGYFSRYESLSSLDESQDKGENIKVEAKREVLNSKDVQAAPLKTTPPLSELPPSLPAVKISKQPANEGNMLNSAQETPLMFSRHSSMDSLVEEGEDDVGPCDDKSSVVSDFSRLASGVISPSELPDSPTQSMPQSPRRNSAFTNTFSTSASPVAMRRTVAEAKRPLLKSVFEDGLNTFHVENTPAQFSCATSLSNLSIMDDENLTSGQPCAGKLSASNTPASTTEQHTNQVNQPISEGEEDETGTNNDDLLLANCINIGMKRSTSTAQPNNKKATAPTVCLSSQEMTNDEPKHYFTEDTPALLSKVGSNTNLSMLSICSSNNDLKDDTVYEIIHTEAANSTHRRSLNLSDEVSSNASESGATGQSLDILQQCIRDGMKKPSVTGNPVTSTQMKPSNDPIAMMRRGGNILPPYLPVSDEMNKYLIEGSPCTFSIMSGLSNLTVGSSLVGPAVQLNGNGSEKSNAEHSVGRNKLSDAKCALKTSHSQEDVRRDHQHWQDDSLSSLSIDSEDDSNLLKQAIAAGCNRPKSNLGFSTASTSKRSSSLSASQPTSINTATSASSLTSKSSIRKHQKQQLTQHSNGNESYSSVDSSDSNDNQSKSLLELCILSGMHKSREDSGSSRKRHHHHHHPNQKLSDRSRGDNLNGTQSNPNLKQFDSLAMQSPHQKHLPPPPANRHLRERERERERKDKDEKLLLECINTGISKKIGSGASGSGSATATQNLPLTNKQREQLHFAANSVPKNGEATSAAAQVPYHLMVATISPSAHSTAAPDVEKKQSDIITTISMHSNNYKNSNTNIASSNTNMTTNFHPSNNCINHEDIIDVPKSQLQKTTIDENLPSLEIVREMNDTGCEDLLPTSVSFDNVTNSDESNESFIMETTVSLESTQNASVVPSDKHKDPDLMLKSVERLTFEFVSSAELLRTNCSIESTEQDKRKGSISIGCSTSNNTWNENTCPNDVSFPSISISAPKVASLNYDDEEVDGNEATEADHKELHDFAEITPTNEEQPQPSLRVLCDETDLYNNTQPNSLETTTETETLMNDKLTESSASGTSVGSSSGISFKLGGEVLSAAATINNKNRFTNCSSGMTNSTFIAIEARTLAENLRFKEECNSDLAFSLNSLDLDNIGPPSGMESLNISGYYQEISTHSLLAQPNSLNRCMVQMPPSPALSTKSAKSPKFPHKLLPSGLVAKRAIGQLPLHLTCSAESVNSSCNLLDNIKPPSLMDELLDSMISVASIQSEVADCESLITTISVSNYQTAAGEGNGDFDDNTITLHSCYNDIMPHDDYAGAGDGTPLPSDNDFSSAESTPKKGAHGSRRSLTPKQKRQIDKERYKTYVIATDSVLSAEQERSLEAAQADEMLQIEITENDDQLNSGTYSQGSGSGSGNGSMKNRRRSIQDRDRYKTQTIIYPGLAAAQTSTDEAANSSLTSNDDCPSDDMSSIRAFTKQFKFITAPVTEKNANIAADCGYNSTEYELNSETESCQDQTQQSSKNEPQDSNDNEMSRYVVPAEELTTVPTQETNIVKAEEENEAKAVRGRKKPTYVSPYSMQYQRSKVTTTNRQINQNTFRKRTTGAQKTPPKLEQKKKTTELKPTECELQRQGTFVKDEPTNTTTCVPVVEATSPSKCTGTKLPIKRPPMRDQQTNGKIPITSTAQTSPRRPPAIPKRSNSNTTMRVTSNAARIAVLSSRISNTTPPSRSNSILNSGQNSVSTKINQAQSRIASIWKRVDEAKNKNKPTKIGYATNLRTQQTKSSPAVNAPRKTLVRSSTFNTTPTTTAGGATMEITNSGGATGPSKIKPVSATSKITALNKSIFSTAARKNIGARK